ncbi:MAG: DUF5681 domain-containing protein [Pseudomonadota bacterium]|nr:DUF5681 domain-containing protein [Pseudomonadota bacterium]
MSNSKKNKQAKPVGYGSPPEEHQWKPGQSGNPYGRPRKKEEEAHPHKGTPKRLER